MYLLTNRWWSCEQIGLFSLNLWNNQFDFNDTGA
jgi:hypothetical protein